MTDYQAFQRRSIDDRDAFWAEQAQRIDWQTQPKTICDYSNPPFARWFEGGTTNLCHHAVDRHLKDRPDQTALIAVSTETDTEQTYTFRQLHAHVQTMAASLLELGVRKGDRVLIYMPMVAEAAFAMLACARIGAIHSVVFGGFASVSLASRIEDASPVVVVSADAGSRGGKVVPYKPLLDEALALSSHKPQAVLLVDRQLAPMAMTAGRDHSWASLQTKHHNAVVPCEWVDAMHPSYTLYTSGTTGKPKGVQRDTGGYSVALAASMETIFCGKAGETYFSTSDIGWVVGHSYIVYGPLIAGMATIMYEGLPIRPDGGIWWSLVEKYKVTVMFSAPTAIRVLKKQDPALLKRYDLSSLRTLFLAGEPLDEPTAQWISDGLGKDIIDNYWQTESGWPILTIANGWKKRPANSAVQVSPCTAMTSNCWTKPRAKSCTARIKKACWLSKGPCHRAACKPFGRMMRALSTRIGKASPVNWCTALLTGPRATKTATTSSWVAPTTLSTWLATAWEPAKLRNAFPAIPMCLKWRW